jgi:hypothetical protein
MGCWSVVISTLTCLQQMIGLWDRMGCSRVLSLLVRLPLGLLLQQEVGWWIGAVRQASCCSQVVFRMALSRLPAAPHVGTLVVTIAW